MRGGSIVNVSSVSGIKPFASNSVYGASKAAVRLLSKIAAIERADTANGIRVNVVSPGGVKTPMWEKMDFFRGLVEKHGGTDQTFEAMAGTKSEQFFTADEVARTIVYLASGASNLTGVAVVLDWGHTG